MQIPDSEEGKPKLKNRNFKNKNTVNKQYYLHKSARFSFHTLQSLRVGQYVQMGNVHKIDTGYISSHRTCQSVQEEVETP